MGNSKAVCVVGGGPSGMALARSLMHRGLTFDVFERHGGPGGIWDQTNPGSPVYDSAHFISSAGHSHFHDFPMPDSYPDYPSHHQILQYMESFTDEYQLRDQIQFGIGVESTERTDEGWIVNTSDGQTRRYGSLICATGTNWYGSLPNYPGTFDGEFRHSQSYRSTTEFVGNRVLVVGAGNSGVDIACDAAQAAEYAAISMRRGYHFIPKHLFGMPSDEFGDTGPTLPMWLTQRVFGGLLRLINGDVTRLGLQKPDHKLFETHPILNTQILHYLAHGDLTAKPDIERFDGSVVHFSDGTSEAFDVVLCATGYKWKIPYVEESHFDWKNGRPDMYMNLFSRTDPALYALGYMETNGGAYKLFDEMADLIVRTIVERAGSHSKVIDEMIANDRPDLSGGIKFVGSDRHSTYVEISAFRKQISRLLDKAGWSPLSEGIYDHLRAPSPI